MRAAACSVCARVTAAKPSACRGSSSWAALLAAMRAPPSPMTLAGWSVRSRTRRCSSAVGTCSTSACAGAPHARATCTKCARCAASRCIRSTTTLRPCSSAARAARSTFSRGPGLPLLMVSWLTCTHAGAARSSAAQKNDLPAPCGPHSTSSKGWRAYPPSSASLLCSTAADGGSTAAAAPNGSGAAAGPLLGAPKACSGVRKASVPPRSAPTLAAKSRSELLKSASRPAASPTKSERARSIGSPPLSTCSMQQEAATLRPRGCNPMHMHRGGGCPTVRQRSACSMAAHMPVAGLRYSLLRVAKRPCSGTPQRSASQSTSVLTRAAVLPSPFLEPATAPLIMLWLDRMTILNPSACMP